MAKEKEHIKCEVCGDVIWRYRYRIPGRHDAICNRCLQKYYRFEVKEDKDNDKGNEKGQS